MNFEWMLFRFTSTDCKNLCQAVKSSKQLTVLRLHHSQVADDQARLLISYLLDHPVLRELGRHGCCSIATPMCYGHFAADLSHNKLADGAGRALSKLLNGHSCIHTLNVCNNSIGGQGGIAIGHTLANNTTLTSLNLRMNRCTNNIGSFISSDDM